MMNRKNTGLKLTIFLLVVVCIYLLYKVTDQSDMIQMLDEKLDRINQRIEKLQVRVEELEETNNGKMSYDATQYGLHRIDWEKGIITWDVEFSVKNATGNTTVVVDNTIEKVELAGNSGVYKGRISYPIDNKDYDTTYYIYNGDVLVDSVRTESMTFDMLAAKMLWVEYDDSAYYGNDKLTVAGKLNWNINPEEEITKLELVFGDERVNLKPAIYGEADINMSQAIRLDGERFRELYMEATDAKGNTYKIYPPITVSHIYEVPQPGVEFNVSHIYQEWEVEITLANGKQYKLK